MKLVNFASVLTAVAVLSVPPITVDAAETAKAMLKDANGQEAGSASFNADPRRSAAAAFAQRRGDRRACVPHPCSGQVRTEKERVGRRAFQPGQCASRDDVGARTRRRYAEPARSGKRRPRSRSAQHLDHPREGQAQFGVSSWAGPPSGRPTPERMITRAIRPEKPATASSAV